MTLSPDEPSREAAHSEGQQGEDLGAAWLPLIVQLSQQFPDVAVWKNADPALRGVGDIDLIAPRHRWAIIEGQFADWAADQGLRRLPPCFHSPGVMQLVAVTDGDTRLWQLDVKERLTLHGACVLVAADLLELMEMDDRDFRRLRPGAEGLLKLVTNGMTLTGAPKEDRLVKERVVELLRNDVDGAAAASRLFAPAGRLAQIAAETAARGGWHRLAMTAVMGRVLIRALRHPAVAYRQVVFRVADARRCPLIWAIVENDRRAPDPAHAWMRAVADAHAVPERSATRGPRSGR